MSFLENCLQITLKFTSQTRGDVGQNRTSLLCLMKTTAAKPWGFGRAELQIRAVLFLVTSLGLLPFSQLGNETRDDFSKQVI